MVKFSLPHYPGPEGLPYQGPDTTEGIIKVLCMPGYEPLIST
jgi:hypothetical protein